LHFWSFFRISWIYLGKALKTGVSSIESVIKVKGLSNLQSTASNPKKSFLFDKSTVAICLPYYPCSFSFPLFLYTFTLPYMTAVHILTFIYPSSIITVFGCKISSFKAFCIFSSVLSEPKSIYDLKLPLKYS
jgi:antibiotic biosynthesis monooxygenase (ABM) superfamily enzyme